MDNLAMMANDFITYRGLSSLEQKEYATEIEEKLIDDYAHNKAEQLIKNKDWSIMVFISDNSLFIKKYEELIFNLVNNASIEALENLQHFIHEMAYESVKNEIKTCNARGYGY